MATSQLAVLLLFWVFFTITSVSFCYFYAVAVDHLYPFVPSISNTGAKQPEGNIFAEAVNISSVLSLLIITARYMQLNYKASHLARSIQRINILSLVSGIISTLGITLVANFPSDAEEYFTATIHDIGAVTAFVGAAIYCFCQTSTTWKLYCYEKIDRFSWIYRLILTSVLFLSGSFFLLSSIFAFNIFKECYSDEHEMLKWEPGDCGYGLHVASNVCEWLAASSFILFLASYFNEFQEVQITAQCVQRNCGEAKAESLTKLNNDNENDSY